jgi:hypothetical protein
VAIRRFFKVTLALQAALLLANSQASDPNASSSNVKKSKWRDPSDGALDLSEFLEKPGGFVPLVMPVTEPAVGIGVAVFPIFLRPRTSAGSQGYARPNITTAGGLYTSNNTWGAFGADSSIWKDGRIETFFAGGHASINLKYYGDQAGKNAPFIGYTLSTTGGVARGRFRLGNTKFYVGLRYLYLQVDSAPKSSEGAVAPPEGLGRSDRLAGPSAFLTYDSRDNILTPTRGLFSESTFSYFDRAFGGTLNYQRFQQVTIGFVPLHPRWTLGIYTDAAFSFNDPVFYARPYVKLRGIPALRYQRQNVVQSELELRWQFWRRFSVVSFGGGGLGWDSGRQPNRSVTVGAGGVGFRYLLARKFGLHYGIDVARGPADWAMYFQFGSAWLRP